MKNTYLTTFVVLAASFFAPCVLGEVEQGLKSTITAFDMKDCSPSPKLTSDLTIDCGEYQDVRRRSTYKTHSLHDYTSDELDSILSFSGSMATDVCLYAFDKAGDDYKLSDAVSAYSIKKGDSSKEGSKGTCINVKSNDLSLFKADSSFSILCMVGKCKKIHQGKGAKPLPRK